MALAPVVGWFSSAALLERSFGQAGGTPAQDRARFVADGISSAMVPVVLGAGLSIVALVVAVVFGVRLARAKA